MRTSFITKNVVVAFLLTSLLALQACKLDEDLGKPTFSPDFTLPMAYGTLGLKDLFQDTTFIKTDPTGYLKVAYFDTLAILGSSDIEPLLNLAQLNVDIPQTLRFSNVAGVETLRDTFSYTVLLPMGLSYLKGIAFDNLTFRITINNQKPFALNGLTIRIPGLKENGVEFSRGPFNIPAGSNFVQPFTVNNATWDLRGTPGVADTATTFSMVHFVFSSPGGISGTAGGLATISLGFTAYDMDYWIGGSPLLPQVLGSIPPIESSGNLVPASTYKQIRGGSLTINDAKINTIFQSRLGLPLGMKLNLASTNGVDGTVVALDDTFRVNINASTLLNGVPQKTNSFSEIADSLGLVDVLTNFPTKIDVSAGIQNLLDPNGREYFVHDSSDINLLVFGDVPFAITFDSLTLVDTFKFDLLSSLGDGFDTATATIDTGVFTFDFENGFPYSINIRATALNGALDSVDELVNIVLLGANTVIDPVTGEEIVVTKTKSTTYFTFNQTKFENLKRGKNLQIVAVLDTPTGVDKPKIFINYGMNFKVKARLKATVEALNN
jgi:hypothetical protein